MKIIAMIVLIVWLIAAEIWWRMKAGKARPRIHWGRSHVKRLRDTRKAVPRCDQPP